MGPAATAFTRTPRGLYSAVQLWVMDARAALVAPYAAPAGKPIRRQQLRSRPGSYARQRARSRQATRRRQGQYECRHCRAGTRRTRRTVSPMSAMSNTTDAPVRVLADGSQIPLLGL